MLKYASYIPYYSELVNYAFHKLLGNICKYIESYFAVLLNLKPYYRNFENIDYNSYFILKYVDTFFYNKQKHLRNFVKCIFYSCKSTFGVKMCGQVK